MLLLPKYSKSENQCCIAGVPTGWADAVCCTWSSTWPDCLLFDQLSMTASALLPSALHRLPTVPQTPLSGCAAQTLGFPLWKQLPTRLKPTASHVLWA